MRNRHNNIEVSFNGSVEEITNIFEAILASEGLAPMDVGSTHDPMEDVTADKLEDTKRKLYWSKVSHEYKDYEGNAFLSLLTEDEKLFFALNEEVTFEDLKYLILTDRYQEFFSELAELPY